MSIRILVGAEGKRTDKSSYELEFIKTASDLKPGQPLFTSLDERRLKDWLNNKATEVVNEYGILVVYDDLVLTKAGENKMDKASKCYERVTSFMMMFNRLVK